MRVIELDKAVQHIRRACNSGRRAPFFFIVGAGISNPPVPLASEIQQHCRAIALSYDSADGTQGKSAIDRYSYWFDRAYEQPVMRQEYLRGLIEGTTISHANFRLAHLLLEKQISNIVVTPNFDDFLSRALILFGKPHIVCDHPRTVERINPERDDIQILHVHGTYWFYDCCNLKDEIENRARASEDTNETMAFKLDDILSRRSPLVIGYSGWEGDVIMSALKRRLQTDLPYNLYWFCYKANAIDSLPGWLKSHPRVVFVTSKDSFSNEATSDGSKELRNFDEAHRLHQQALEIASKVGQKELHNAEGQPSSTQTVTIDFPETKQEEAGLSAEQVLDRLIQSFDLQAPTLTSDPLGFFSKYLHDLLPQDNNEKETGSVYSFGSVVARIERAKQNEIIQDNEVELERVRDALRRSQYREAIQQGINVSLEELDQRQLADLMAAMVTAAASLNDNSGDDLPGFDLVIAIGDSLSKQGIDEPSSKEHVARALLLKAERLSNLGRYEAAFIEYNEIVRRYGTTTDPTLRQQLGMALTSKGYMLLKLNRHEEAIVQYDLFLRDFGAEPVLQNLVAMSSLNRGYCLGALKRHDEAIAQYDKLIGMFGGATELLMQGLVAKALTNKGGRLHDLDRNEDAIAQYDDVIKRFGKSNELILRERVAAALANKGWRLAELGRTQEAERTHEQVVKRFGEAIEPELKEWVSKSFNTLGFRLLLNAKKAWVTGEEETAKLTLVRASDKIEGSLRSNPKNAMALGNKAYISFLLGNEEEARLVLTEAIRLGGEDIRQGELEDSSISPLPQDELFRRLVLSIPLPNVSSDPHGSD